MTRTRSVFCMVLLFVTSFGMLVRAQVAGLAVSWGNSAGSNTCRFRATNSTGSTGSGDPPRGSAGGIRNHSLRLLRSILCLPRSGRRDPA